MPVEVLSRGGRKLFARSRVAPALRVRPAYVARRRSMPPKRASIPVVLAVLLDLASWLLFALSWSLEGYAIAAGWVTAFLLAACGAVTAIFGVALAAMVARRRGDHAGPAIRPGLIALGGSIGSIVLFVLLIELIVSFW